MLSLVNLKQKRTLLCMVAMSYSGPADADHVRLTEQNLRDLQAQFQLLEGLTGISRLARHIIRTTSRIENWLQGVEAEVPTST